LSRTAGHVPESSTSQKSASKIQTLQATADTEITADADCLCGLYSFTGGFDLGWFTEWTGVVAGQPDECAQLLALCPRQRSSPVGQPSYSGKYSASGGFLGRLASSMAGTAEITA